MFLIFCEVSVMSTSRINTNKCMRQSRLVQEQKENVMQNTEEKPHISQTSSGRPGPHQQEEKKDWDDFSTYRRLLASEWSRTESM